MTVARSSVRWGDHPETTSLKVSNRTALSCGAWCQPARTGSCDRPDSRAPLILADQPPNPHSTFEPNIGAEVLAAVRDLKAGRVGRIVHVPSVSSIRSALLELAA